MVPLVSNLITLRPRIYNHLQLVPNFRFLSTDLNFPYIFLDKMLKRMIS